ncbi:MAG: hypothetical protein ACOX6T_13990 [Myxococcales bacterium]|jgi:hypothetical protein
MPGTAQQQVVESSQLSQEAVEAIAAEIERIERASVLDLYVGVGKTILERGYEGSFELWNARNVGDESLKRISKALAQKEVDWSEWKLYRAVRTYEQQVSLGGFERWPSLKASHFHAVQGLPYDKQRELLDTAQGQRQSVRDLQRAANQARGLSESAPAAPSPFKEASRVLRRFDKLLEEREELAVDLAEAGIPEEWVARFSELLEALHAEVETLSSAMQEAK